MCSRLLKNTLLVVAVKVEQGFSLSGVRVPWGPGPTGQ
jgi:hypothetical protein